MRLYSYSSTLFAACCALAFAWPTTAAAGTTYQVGAGKPYARISDVPLLAPGDVVEISSGTYSEAVRWTTSGTAVAPIIIRGVGSTRPIIDGTGVGISGVLPQPRALFQIEGDHIVIENLEFRNAHNNVGNGAGIRVLFGRSALIRNVRITRCDMGMQANGHDDLIVEHSEIAENGAAGVYSHNVYIADGGITTFRFNYIHDSVSGQNFKSRSHFTQLLYNYIADSADGEIGLVDSVSTDQAHSNALMLGNVIVSKVRSASNNQAKFIDFGQDNGVPHRGVLYLFHNTLVAGTPAIQFLWASSSQASIVAEHNIFVGSNTIVGMTGKGVSGARNWVPASATVPSTWTATVLGLAPGFVDASTRDYRLTSSSAAVDLGSGPSLYLDGSGLSQWAATEWEYLHPVQRAPRLLAGASDLGAYEALGSTSPPPPPAAGISLTATGYKVKGLQKVDLKWSGASGVSVDVWRNGVKIVPETSNDAAHTDNINNKGGGTYLYKICDAGSTATCSNEASAGF